MEPARLKYGKKFHKEVQLNFEQFSEGKPIREAEIQVLGAGGKKRGRMDMLITEMDNDVAIFEIKGTNWDCIKPANVKRNLYNHQRQLFKYIDSYMKEHEAVNVTIGVIYPRPPRSRELQVFLEEYMMNQYSVPIYYYTDVESK